MAYQLEDIADMVIASDRDRGRNKTTILAMDLQKYIALNELMVEHRVTLSGGTGYEWRLETNLGNSFRHCGIYDVNVPASPNVFVQASERWRGSTVNCVWDEFEFTSNMGENQILDLIESRKRNANLQAAKGMEDTVWSKPVDSTDNTTPLGIPYWIVKNNTTGFNGGNPSGFTSGCGGVSSSTYTAWANYTAQYTNVTKADLIRKLRAALYKTDFTLPVEAPQFVRGNQYAMYTNYAVVSAVQEIQESQNQNLGRDVASMDNGTVILKQIPMIPVPKLEADTDNPVYGINWDSLKFAVPDGWWDKVKTFRSPTQRNVIERHQDWKWNTICYDRRQNFVVALDT